MFQPCRAKNSWDMDISNSKYYCCIALLHVKTKITQNCCTSLIICCLNTPNKILTSWKVQPSIHNQSWDMDISSSKYYCSIALLHVTTKITQTS